jgi:hypothetical protein
MKVSLDAKDAKEWFGALPPDLTLIARSRADGAKGSGADYLYTYLRTYYRDETKATGWNNLAFPSVGMPHVLWELQGQQRAVFADEKDPHDPAKTVHVFKGFEQITPGTLSRAEYDLPCGRSGGLPAVDGRAGNAEASACAWACGCCCSWRVHRDRLAPERGVLERRQVNCIPARRFADPAPARSGLPSAPTALCFWGQPQLT